jgi:hypothetical protein
MLADKEKRFKGPSSVLAEQARNMDLEARGNKLISGAKSIFFRMGFMIKV